MISKELLFKISTSDTNAINAWDKLVDTIESCKTDFILQYQELSGGKLSTRGMTIVEVHGHKDILVKIESHTSRIDHMISHTKRVLLEALWEIFQQCWKGWTEEHRLSERAQRYILASLEKSIYCEELKTKEWYAN